MTENEAIEIPSSETLDLEKHIEKNGKSLPITINIICGESSTQKLITVE